MDLLSLGSPLSRHRAALMGLFLLFALLLTGCAPLSPAQPPTPLPEKTSPAAPTAAVSRPIASPTAPVLPTASPTPNGCTEKTGRVDRQQIDSPNLPRPLQVRVYLPPCYSTAKPYPLLLMLHGQTADAGQWESLGLFQAADHLILQEHIAPLVIVLPQEDDNLGNPFESGFDRALIDDLLPWLRQNYAVCPSRGCTSIGGLSRGAAWAMYLGLSRPDIFTAVGAHSFPSFYGDDTRLPILLRGIPEGQLPRIWMDIGERDRYLSQARRYHELLDQYHVPHEWHLNSGEHDAAYWSAHAVDYLLWYSPLAKNLSLKK